MKYRHKDDVGLEIGREIQDIKRIFLKSGQRPKSARTGIMLAGRHRGLFITIVIYMTPFEIRVLNEGSYFSTPFGLRFIIVLQSDRS